MIFKLLSSISHPNVFGYRFKLKQLSSLRWD